MLYSNVRDFFVGAFCFVKDAGVRGVFCELFNLDSKHNYTYVISFTMGKIMKKEHLDRLIFDLACDIPYFEPQKTMRICQLRGLSDARKINLD